ncbi:hypothetical protein ES703_109352 [subsurface metagenome]
MLNLPIHDLPTRSASGFLIRYILPRSIPPQLVGPLDRKVSFTTLTIGDAIIGVGHGSPTEFCGHNNEVILDITSIPDVKDKVVILISCETAQRLGQSLINAGALSYIGWNDDLVWVCDSDLASTPWSDKMALTVMGPITDCVNIILDGRTVGEAYNTMLRELSENAEVEEDELVKACLEFNRKNAVLLGSGDATIRKRPPLPLPFKLIPPPPPIVLPFRA